jgi:hypothetical protein
VSLSHAVGTLSALNTKSIPPTLRKCSDEDKFPHKNPTPNSKAELNAIPGEGAIDVPQVCWKELMTYSTVFLTSK